MWKVLARRRARRALAEQLLGISLPPGALSEARLDWAAEQLRRARIDWGLLTPHVRFHRAHYLRRPLFRGRGWELVVCTWLPGQASAVHDHGGSAGVTLVLSGKLSEMRYRLDGGSLQAVGSRLVAAGDTLVERSETIHRVLNVGREPVVSLHLYSPPIERMQRFADPGTSREPERSGAGISIPSVA